MRTFSICGMARKAASTFARSTENILTPSRKPVAAKASSRVRISSNSKEIRRKVHSLFLKKNLSREVLQSEEGAYR